MDKIIRGDTIWGRWSEENPNPHAIYPRIYTASSPHTTYNRAFNDYHVFDADYFRFKTMTIGYNIPRNIVSRLGMSSLKVYLTGEIYLRFVQIIR